MMKTEINDMLENTTDFASIQKGDIMIIRAKSSLMFARYTGEYAPGSSSAAFLWCYCF